MKAFQNMQFSKGPKRSRVASMHFRRRLTILLIAILLLVIGVLVVCQGFSPISVAGNTSTHTHTPIVGDTGGGTVGCLSTLPEYNFAFGGIIAVIICFAAFGVFAKRGKLSGKR
jgi:uncharacterized membrane protein